MPGCFRACNPDLKAIILSVHDERTVVDECLAAGAKGFVLKRTAFSDLLPAIEAVMKGDTYISPAISPKQENLTADPEKPRSLTDGRKEQ